MGHEKRILPTDFPSIGIPWLMEAPPRSTARRGGRAPAAGGQRGDLQRARSAGPDLSGRCPRAVNRPTSIVVHGLALNITVQSFDAHMDFGLMADATAPARCQAPGTAVDGPGDELRALPRARHAPTAASRTRLPSRVSAPPPQARFR